MQESVVTGIDDSQQHQKIAEEILRQQLLLLLVKLSTGLMMITQM